MEQEMSMKEKLDFLMAERIKEVKPKTRKIKIPRKAKVSKSKIRKGWLGIIKIDENGNISGEKQKVIDSTIRLKDGDYHSIDGEQVGFFDGKYPVIIQQTFKEEPMRIRRSKDERNETAHQKYIMARMLGDVIKVKKGNGMPLVWIIGLAIAGYVAYSLLTGGA